MKTSSLVKLVCGIALLAAILPAAAFGQATRTWVSGVGDDANPCSRTAPCKTFAGAISKTATGGEINCLDPGGFGGVTITKAITIKCQYTEGGVLVSGTNAIIINATATSNVTLRGLDINGLGTGLNAVRILAAGSVHIIDNEMYGFVRNAVDFESSSNPSKLLVSDSHIHGNSGVGVFVAPPSGGNSNANVHNNLIVGNACAVAASNHLADPAFNFLSNCGTQVAGVGGPAKINAFRNVLGDSASVGAWANGQSSQVRIGDNEIVGNQQGVQAIDNGAFGGIFSFSDNYFAGNVADGTITGTIVKK